MTKVFPLTILLSLLMLTTVLAQTTYYVSKSGNNDNSGTEESSPFLTIRKAAGLVTAGDVVIISEGTYRESVVPSSSGTAEAPITFMAKEGDEVTISGLEPLSGWELDEGSIYKTDVLFNSGFDNMVMYGDRLCDLARYPNNVDGDPFTVDGQNNTGGSLSEMTGSFPDLDWSDGGFVWYMGTSRWTSWRAIITGASRNKVEYRGPDGWEGSAHNPKDGGEFILMGIKEAIDYEYEFYYDIGRKVLYLQTPDGEVPADSLVQMKRRTNGFILNSKNHIVIDGIDFYGCGIDVNGSSTGNLIKNLKVMYGNHAMGVGTAAFVDHQSINLRGSNNRVERCEIGWGANTGIRMGGDGNEVHDCIIHDFNYIGSYGAPVMMRSGSNSKLTQSTLFNAGRDVIQAVNDNVEIAFNDVYNSNLINDDCGTFYTCCGEHFTEIHHNFFHDSDSRGDKYKAAGIYLDNDVQAYDVHHNVVYNMEWTGIQMNWDNWNFNIYNNTIWNVSEAMGEWTPSGKEKKDLIVVNNLSNEDTWIGTDVSNNLDLSSSPFVDFEKENFQLKNGSNAIDFGKTVSGLDIEYKGSSPDAGAFEDGMEPWVPGATWINESTVNVKEFDISPLALKVYPNPGMDYIRLESVEEGQYELFIFDNSGKVLMHQEAYQTTEAIDVSGFETGMYFVYLRKGNALQIGKVMVLR